jgi:drug/metabolite transporter (DMT)-like permease
MPVTKSKLFLAFAAVYILWGSTYFAIRIAIETLPPFFMAGTRFLCAGSLLYLYAARKEKGKPTLIHWRAALITGILLLVGGNGCVVWAEQRVPTGITALIIATVPFWTVLLESFFYGKKPSLRVIIGMALGFSGLWLLLRPANYQGNIDLLGVFVLLFAAFSWACGSLYSRRTPFPHTAFLPTAMEMICGGSVLFLISAGSGEFARISAATFSFHSVSALVYLIFFGALVGFTAYKYILKHTPPVLSSTYAYVNPVIAVFLGSFFLKEPLGSGILTGAFIILAGVFMITLSGRTKKNPAGQV